MPKYEVILKLDTRLLAEVVAANVSEAKHKMETTLKHKASKMHLTLSQRNSQIVEIREKEWKEEN